MLPTPNPAHGCLADLGRARLLTPTSIHTKANESSCLACPPSTSKSPVDLAIYRKARRLLLCVCPCTAAASRKACSKRWRKTHVGTIKSFVLSVAGEREASRGIPRRGPTWDRHGESGHSGAQLLWVSKHPRMGSRKRSLFFLLGSGGLRPL